MMWLYSLVLAAVLVVSSPWWLIRMITTERYREGMRERTGGVPERLRAGVAGFAEQRRVVWVHAVSVGEVLAASRLVGELEAALSAGGEPWRVVISTTTRTGQRLARERFGAERVFYFPLDFASSVRAYLRVLHPAALVLMESELWPRVLYECGRVGVPVVVVNARVSDRSFARGMKVRRVWRGVLRKVSLWLAQSDEDVRRLVAMGARAESVRAIGNLKYDIRAPKESRVAELIKKAAAGRPIVVAGSTVDRNDNFREESYILRAWEGGPRREQRALLVIAPRHPERFGLIESVVCEYVYAVASDSKTHPEKTELQFRQTRAHNEVRGREGELGLVLLDTMGDLAGVYSIADVAFVGGSLLKRGGHNPLEPAQFGVPVVMGPSFENFRDIVAKMQAADAIRIAGGTENAGRSTPDARSEASARDHRALPSEELERVFLDLLRNREAGRALGERGRRVFEQQQGATARAVEAIVAMIRSGANA